MMLLIIVIVFIVLGHLHAIKTGIALAKGDPVAKDAILKLMNEAELVTS